MAPAHLDDPAFSQDPRAHPHFSLANAIPPPPPEMPRVPHVPPRQALKPVPTNIPRKARMKAFVRRLTSRHNLDRIDELDETDPFGASYHHDGPYEAISSNLAQPSMHTNAAPRRNYIHHSKREFDPPPLRPGQYQVPPAYGEIGLSLHLEPGQILQQNTIYAPNPASVTAVLGQFHPHPSTVSITTQPHYSRRRSLPNPRTFSPRDPSPPDLRVGFQHRQSLSLPPPRERYIADYTADISSRHLPHHGHDTATPYVLHQTEKPVFPPPRYESRLHSSGPPLSPQRTPPPSLKPTSLKTQSTDSVVPTSLGHDPRHKGAHSSDSSHFTINSTFSQPTSGMHDRVIDPPKAPHLPKRLVMPAPLQSQPPLYKFPMVDTLSGQDEYPDYRALEDARFDGKPTMYNQQPRLLRKKSSAFPVKIPILNHVPMPQDDAVPRMGNSPAKMTNEAEGTKERTRRQRLSKRKG